MNAGRELDALVAEKVMGWNVFLGEENLTITMRQVPEEHRHLKRVWVYDGMRMACEECGDLPAFSTDISAAMDIFKRFMPFIKLDGRGLGLGARDVVCRIWTGYGEEDEGSVSASHVKIPMAICLAACKARGVEVPA